MNNKQTSVVLQENVEALENERNNKRTNQIKNQIASLKIALENDGRGDPDHSKTPFPIGFEGRYFTKSDKDGITVFADTKGEKELFRDFGEKLQTKDQSELATRTMVETARHRGWDAITVRGTTDFQREIWLESQARGINVKGYKPNDLDQQELKLREQRHLGNQVIKDNAVSIKTSPSNHDRDETHSGMTKRAAMPQRNGKDTDTPQRQALEAALERELLQKFPEQANRIETNMKSVRKSIDDRIAQGDKLPDIKIKQTREIDQTSQRSAHGNLTAQPKQDVKQQVQDKDMEKRR